MKQYLVIKNYEDTDLISSNGGYFFQSELSTQDGKTSKLIIRPKNNSTTSIQFILIGRYYTLFVGCLAYSTTVMRTPAVDIFSNTSNSIATDLVYLNDDNYLEVKLEVWQNIKIFGGFNGALIIRKELY